MADSALSPGRSAEIASVEDTPRHTAIVRVTHWITALCFLALLVSGIEILISHPRFYWGETGNVMTPALFEIPIPASRAAVKTGYNYVLPDQNGWSRYLHFQAAWFAVLTGLLYVISGLITAHFRKNLFPAGEDLAPKSLAGVIANHLRFKLGDEDPSTYNVLQRLTYVAVVFVLFPLAIWTGLAMSPAVTSALPFIVTMLGGQQSARTIHFFVFVALGLFLVGHIAMVCLTGFKDRMRGMTTGRGAAAKGDQ